MKDGDSTLKKAIKSRRDIDRRVLNGLKIKVFQEMRPAKPCFFLCKMDDAKGKVTVNLVIVN